MNERVLKFIDGWIGDIQSVIEQDRGLGIAAVSEESQVEVLRDLATEIRGWKEPDTPGAALARAVLSGSDGAIPALLDAACESYQHDGPDLAARAKELAEEIRAAKADGTCGVGVQEILHAKLRQLGYGEAVDASLVRTTFPNLNWSLTESTPEVENEQWPPMPYPQFGTMTAPRSQGEMTPLMRPTP